MQGLFKKFKNFLFKSVLTFLKFIFFRHVQKPKIKLTNSQPQNLETKIIKKKTLKRKPD